MLMDMRLVPFLSAASCALLLAQDPQDGPTIVRATGEAAVSVRADEARSRVAVMTTAGTAERAREKNAERATTVIARLRELLGPDANIRTANFLLTKTYTEGYVANNTIEAHINDPATTGKVIDAATRAGASVIGGMDASALDEQDARSEALKQATARARTNAEAIATALGMRVVRVLSAETSAVPVTTPLTPMAPRVSLKKKGGVPTPVANGTVEIHSQVTVTVELAP